MKLVSNFFLFSLLANIAFSFDCSDIYLDTKETLDKALNGVKEIEQKKRYSNSEEIITWYINPCKPIENKPEGDIKCPKNSRVCYVKSTIYDNENNKIRHINDIKGYAIDGPSEPKIVAGDYVMEFEGEKFKEDSKYTSEIKLTCAGNPDSVPIVDLNSDNKANIVFKGICVSNNKESPVEDGDDNNEHKKSGHGILKFIFLVISCYFIVGMAYNYFALNKRGVEIIPNSELWLAIYDGISNKISSIFGKREYRPILQ